jgi:hypothetical protein
VARGVAGLNEGGTANALERRVGEPLQAARRHREWSLRELAEASSLSLTTVHQSTRRGSAGRAATAGRARDRWGR